MKHSAPYASREAVGETSPADSKAPCIGILGHFGNSNLGDEAITTAVIQGLREQAPGATLVAYSAFPEDTEARHGIPAFPVQRGALDRTLDAKDATEAERGPGHESEGAVRTSALREGLKAIPPLRALVRGAKGLLGALRSVGRELRFLPRCYRNLKEVDLLLVAGSNQCFDFFGGPWNFPYSLLKWTLIARIQRTSVAFVSVGAGPIRHGLSKLFLRRALAVAAYRSFRDRESMELIRSIGAGQPGDLVTPDLAIGLNPEECPGYVDEEGSGRTDGRTVVAVNPMPLFDGRYWPDAEPERYRTYIGRLASFVEWLHETGRRVFLFGTHPRDQGAARDVLARLPAETADAVSVARARELGELLRILSGADLVVATRFHGVLLSYVVNRPVLGLEYWRKTSEMMSYMGQEAYVLRKEDFLEAERCDPGRMKAMFEELEGRLDRERQTIARSLESHRATLGRQYRRLLGLLEGRRS